MGKIDIAKAIDGELNVFMDSDGCVSTDDIYSILLNYLEDCSYSLDVGMLYLKILRKYQDTKWIDAEDLKQFLKGEIS